jgi:hypothetical protein
MQGENYFCGRDATAIYAENSDAPRGNVRLKDSRAGYVVSYLQASKEGGEAKRLGKGLCVNNYCTSGQQACAEQEGGPNRLERAKEFEKGFFFVGFELSSQLESAKTTERPRFAVRN